MTVTDKDRAERRRTLTRNMTTNPVEVQAVAAIFDGLPYGLTEPDEAPTVQRFFVETIAQAQLDIIETGRPAWSWGMGADVHAGKNLRENKWPLAKAEPRELSRICWLINAVAWEADDHGQMFVTGFDGAVRAVLGAIYTKTYKTIGDELNAAEPTVIWDYENKRLAYNYDAG